MTDRKQTKPQPIINENLIARTLMEATVRIRKAGLKNRMPQEPLEFLSDMHTLCMKMSSATAK